MWNLDTLAFCRLYNCFVSEGADWMTIQREINGFLDILWLSGHSIVLLNSAKRFDDV